MCHAHIFSAADEVGFENRPKHVTKPKLQSDEDVHKSLDRSNAWPPALELSNAGMRPSLWMQEGTGGTGGDDVTSVSALGVLRLY